MSHEHDHEHEHEEMDVITLTLEDDSELDCAVIGIFPFEEKDYIALLPLKGEEVDEDACGISRCSTRRNTICCA